MVETLTRTRTPITTRVFLPPGASLTALRIPAGVTWAEYSRLGHGLGRMGRAVQWWLGDWLVHGTHKFGEKYAQAASETGFDENTLASAQYVAERFTPDRRWDSLSWSHHREVAALEPKLADGWLTKANTERWSRSDFRKQLQADGAKPATRSGGATDDEHRVRLTRVLATLQGDLPKIGSLGVTLEELARRLVAAGVRVAMIDA